MMERDPYLGRLVTGRISSGVVRVGDRVHGLRWQDDVSQVVESGKVRKVLDMVGWLQYSVDVLKFREMSSM